MPRLLTGVLVLVVPGVLAGCGADDGGGTSAEPVVVTGSGPVSLDIGAEMVVELDANQTTGFQWSVESNSSEAVVRFDDQTYLEPSDPALGAGGTERLTFTALTAGEAEIVLVYTRPFEGDSPPAETVTLDVTVSADAPVG